MPWGKERCLVLDDGWRDRRTDRQSETGVRDGDGDGHRPGLLLFKLASSDDVL